MKVLITGANGFIGYNLTKACLNQQHDLLLFSRSVTNIASLNYRCWDFKNVEVLTNDILNFKPDAVVHCAWDGGNSYSDIHNKKQFSNVLYSLKFLEIVAKLKNVHFIGLGSAAEYGNSSEIINEEITELPINYYGMSKLSFKEVSYEYCKKNNLLWTWVRPMYTYGPHDVISRLIPKTIINCLQNKDVELSSCSSIIDYLYIDDFVDGIIKILEQQLEGVYNVCSGKQFEIKTIVNTIHELCGSKNKIFFNKELDRKNFPQKICGSNNKLINASNKSWQPKINLIDGLTKTINFYETFNNN